MRTSLQEAPGRDTPGLPILGWLVLALTAAMAALWSSHKLLEQDEIFSLQTDRVSSLAEVLRIQRLYPISLEPPPYHVLSHAAMQLFGPTAFALRLPAFLGYLLMQACLYFFVRNFVGGPTHIAQRAGLIAMAIPACTWTLYYAAEGRPYGLLLGSYALAVLCWQIATRTQPPPFESRHPERTPIEGRHPERSEGSPYSRTTATARQSRLLPLTGLAFAIALTLNVHFYGILLLIVLCGAELVRTLQRRRLDLPMIAAIALGMASLAATLPYIKSSGEFKKHYYAAAISPHMLTQPYRQMLLDYTTFPHAIQIVLTLLLLLAAAAVLISATRLIRRRTLAAGLADWTILALLLLLPLFAFVLGKAVTHALEVRHSIGAIVGISALIAIALTPLLRNKTAFTTIITALLVAVVLINIQRTRASAADAHALLATLSPPPSADLAGPVYFQDLGQWEVASLYTPDPALRSRLTLVYSRDEEMRFEQHDTMYLTAIHTQRFSPQPIVSYDALRRTPGDHVFVTFHSGWSWTDQAFPQETSTVQSLGHAFGGDLVKVRFR